MELERSKQRQRISSSSTPSVEGPERSPCGATMAPDTSLKAIMSMDYSFGSGSDIEDDAGDEGPAEPVEDPPIDGVSHPGVPVANVASDNAQIAVRIPIGGYVYKRKNIDKKTGRQYFYCVVKDCKAGFYVDRDFPMTVPNGKMHSHDPVTKDKTLIENLQEIALRKYVQKRVDDESSRIRAELLREIEQGKMGFPPPSAITVKKIQNIKVHMQGSVEGKVLKTSLPLELTEVDGNKFLQSQCVTPPILILATDSSCEPLKSCDAFFLCRLKITGPILKNCYCVYAVSELEGRVWPCIWLLFAHIPDKRISNFPWIQLKHFINGITGCAKRWVIPIRRKYVEAIHCMLGRLDSVKGLRVSYKYKIGKIVGSIADEEVSAKMQKDLLDFSTLSKKDYQRQLSRISEENPDESVQRALHEWKTAFSTLEVLYHDGMCSRNKLLKKTYTENKHTKHKHRTDEALLKEIQQIYRNTY